MSCNSSFISHQVRLSNINAHSLGPCVDKSHSHDLDIHTYCKAPRSKTLTSPMLVGRNCTRHIPVRNITYVHDKNCTTSALENYSSRAQIKNCIVHLITLQRLGYTPSTKPSYILGTIRLTKNQAVEGLSIYKLFIVVQNGDNKILSKRQNLYAHKLSIKLNHGNTPMLWLGSRQANKSSLANKLR